MKKINRIALVGAVLVMPLWTVAQEPAAQAAANGDFWEKTFGNIVLIATALVVLGSLLSLVRLFSVMVKMQEIQALKEKGLEEIVEQYQKAPQESWWQRLKRAATQYVPVEAEKEILFEHDYDGIRELDNRLPPWWLWLFYVTIIFSAVYFTYYHILGGPTLVEEYERDMQIAQARIEEYKAKSGDQVDENTVTLLTDENELALGQTIFQTNCTPCHGQNGEGNSIGPNLTDPYWIHGGGIKNVFHTISEGVPEKGMVPWKQTLRPKDIQRVASYILVKLQGTNPPNAKEPQGELWQPEDQAPADQNSQTTQQTAEQ